MTKKSTDIFWKIMAVVLAVVVGVQGAILYYGLKGGNDKEKAQDVADDAVLKPRINSPLPYSNSVSSGYNQMPANTVQGTSALKPAPLPKLNLNVNAMPGIKPSQPTPQQSQVVQRGQRPLLSPSRRPSRMMQRMSGMGGSSLMDMEKEFRRMQAMMDQMFSSGGMVSNMRGPTSGLNMQVASPSLSEDNNNFVVKLTIPGLDESNVSASVRNNILTLSGTQTEENEDKSQYGTSYSRSTSSFQNSFSLPGPIKGKGLKVNYDNDILTVVIPKA